VRGIHRESETIAVIEIETRYEREAERVKVAEKDKDTVRERHHTMIERD